MNEEAQKILIDLLKKAANGIDSAVAFSQQQIPDVVNQLLVWNSISSVLTQVACLGIICLVAYIAMRLIKARNAGAKWAVDSYHGSRKPYILAVGATAVFGGMAALTAASIFFSSFDWLKIWLAPKLYLIEYAASLVK